jgi:diaminopimelate epimerase
MDLAFYKLHSTGGDYILSSFVQEPDPDLSVFPALGRLICKRRTGVGANGLLVVTRGIEHAIRLHYFPSARMPGGDIPADAILCAGRYAFNLGLADHSRISAETDNGPVAVEVIDSVNFRIDLGMPSDPETGREIAPTANTELLRTARAEGRRVPYSPISLRKKYAVIATENRPRSIRNLAMEIRDSRDLSGYQPVFMRLISNDECAGYAWATDGEPDHAESIAACAAVGILSGFCDNEVTVRFRSYMIHAQWQPSDGRIYVTAPTEYICTGSYSVEDELLQLSTAT